MNNPEENRVQHISRPGEVPKAVVYTDKATRAMTPAEAKRARFIKSLKNNYARLNEAMAFFDFFASICELSLEAKEDVQKANKAVIDELAAKFQRKLADYDKRNKESR